MLWKKLTLSYVIILFFSIIILGVNMYAINIIDFKTKEIVHKAFPLSKAINTPEKHLVSIQSSVDYYVMTQDSSTIEDLEKNQIKLAKDFKQIETYFKQYPQIKTSVKKQEDQIKKMEAFYKNQIKLVDDFDVVSAQTNIEAGNKMLEKYRSLKDETNQQINKINEEALQKVSSLKNKCMFISLLISLLAFIVICLIAYRMNNRISKPIKYVSDHLKRISEGNLQIEQLEVRSNDEIGLMTKTLNKMVEDLRNIVSEVSISAEQVSSHSDELNVSTLQGKKLAKMTAEINEDNSIKFEEQLTAIDNISSSINSMSISLEKITDQSTAMIHVLEESTNQVNIGTKAVLSVVNQMKEINESVELTTSSIQALGNHSKEISEIVHIITGIADQTNLLALNAAIEAARAGEHGKGFSVVASEVRKLAEESRKSAEKINQMIANVQKKTNDAIRLMNNSVEKIHEGLNFTENANNALQQIDQSIKQTYSKGNNVQVEVNDVEQLSSQILVEISNVHEIVKDSFISLNQTSDASKQQLSSIEDVSISATKLSTLAEQLQKAISAFNLQSVENSDNLENINQVNLNQENINQKNKNQDKKFLKKVINLKIKFKKKKVRNLFNYELIEKIFKKTS